MFISLNTGHCILNKTLLLVFQNSQKPLPKVHLFEPLIFVMVLCRYDLHLYSIAKCFHSTKLSSIFSSVHIPHFYLFNFESYFRCIFYAEVFEAVQNKQTRMLKNKQFGQNGQKTLQAR